MVHSWNAKCTTQSKPSISTFNAFIAEIQTLHLLYLVNGPNYTRPFILFLHTYLYVLVSGPPPFYPLSTFGHATSWQHICCSLSLPLSLSCWWKHTIILINVCEKHYNGTIIEYGHRYMGSEMRWITKGQDEHTIQERLSSWHSNKEICHSNTSSMFAEMLWLDVYQ